MRKYLLPSLICLALGLAFATAQNFTRAIQLSQDTSGAFLTDVNNGVYFPGHQLTTGSAPTFVASASGGAATVVGTDTAGNITMGANSVGGVLTFARAYLAQPYCSVFSTAALATPITASPNAIGTGLVITQVGTSSNVVSYFCTGSK